MPKKQPSKKPAVKESDCVFSPGVITEIPGEGFDLERECTTHKLRWLGRCPDRVTAEFTDANFPLVSGGLTFPATEDGVPYAYIYERCLLGKIPPRSRTIDVDKKRGE